MRAASRRSVHAILSLMIYRHAHRHGVWVDLEQPTPEEIHAVSREFGVHERVEAELLSPTPSPLVAGEGDTAFSALHFPVKGEDESATRAQEIDFVVGRHFLISVRYEVIAPLRELQKVLETDELLSGRTPLTTDVLLEVLFAHLFESVRDYAYHLSNRIATIEREMYAGHERRCVHAISDVSRGFLHLESLLKTQEEPLERFLHTLSEKDFFGPSFKERAARILAEQRLVSRLVETHRALAAELRETNKALLESRQNEIMKTLTVANFIFLPLELIAFVFGMHALGTPLEANPDAFWIIMAFMLVIVAVLTVYFARKRWIF